MNIMRVSPDPTSPLLQTALCRHKKSLRKIKRHLVLNDLLNRCNKVML